MAPLTVLFESDSIVKNEDCVELNKENIFVYPESLMFFFKNIYPFIHIKFNLYTFSCNFTTKGLYKVFDNDNKIIKCEFV